MAKVVVVANLFMMIAAAMVLAIMGERIPVRPITCEDGIKAMVPCEAYLVGRGRDQPPQQCCYRLQNLYESASSTEDRRTLCQCFKDEIGTFGPVVAERAEKLPSYCHIGIPVIISPTVDCSTIP